MDVTQERRRDRLRELFDAVVDADNRGVTKMARHAIESHRGDPLEWMRGN